MILFKNAYIHSPPHESLRADVLIDEGRMELGRAVGVAGVMGCIKEIGRNIQLSSDSNIKVYENKVLLPGYIDSHIHLLEYGLSLNLLDLRKATSSEEVFDMLSAVLPEARQWGFLYAFNLTPERLKPLNWEPLTSQLDKIADDLPIFIRREDGHSVYMNRSARRWLLYDQPLEHADDPLSGRFNELAVERMQDRIPVDFKRKALIDAASALLDRGVTGAAVMIGHSSGLQDIEILRSIEDKIGIRTAIFPQSRDVEKVCAMNLTRLGGCILVDGSFGSRTAALREPYTDAPGNMGILYFSRKELNALVECIQTAGLQMTFHAIGDEAIEILLSSYEKFIEAGNPKRHRVEHAELLAPDLIKRTSDMGIILGVQPMFEMMWGQENGMYAIRLGERRRWTNPYRSILDAGIRIAAGSDAPITNPSPVEGINAFLHHPIVEERITPKEALEAYTYSGAYALHMEKAIGSIAQGLEANILVFNNDPLETLDFNPDAVIYKGKLVRGKL